jgi:hypothetical protein
VESYVGPGSRRTEIRGGHVLERYPQQYTPAGSLVSHLRFALRHEPVDLGVLVATFKAIDPAEVAKWVHAEPTGAYSRRAWFLYETFTGRELDLGDQYRRYAGPPGIAVRTALHAEQRPVVEGEAGQLCRVD